MQEHLSGGLSQSGRKGLRLTPSQVERFFDQGFLIIPDAVSPALLAPLVSEYHQIVDRVSDRHRDQPFERRVALLCKEVPDLGRSLDIHLQLGRRTFDFLRSPELFEIVRPLVGPEITLSPIHHVRTKVPFQPGATGRDVWEVPWHQDAAVCWPEADDDLCVTMWIALSESTRENGCVAVMPGWHKRGLLPHRTTPYGAEIADPPFDPNEKVLVELKKGGLLLMSNYTPHCSLPNQTDVARWSIDLRFQRSGRPTGRPFHPSFVVRSDQQPGRVIKSYDVWKESWQRALVENKGIGFHRYHPKHEEQVRAFYQRKPGATGLVVEPSLPERVRKLGRRVVKGLRGKKPVVIPARVPVVKAAATPKAPPPKKAPNPLGKEAVFHRCLQRLIGENQKWGARGSQKPLPIGTCMEFGVWNGDSMITTWELLQKFKAPTVPWKLLGFDSFEGLPEAEGSADAHRYVGGGSFKSKGAAYVGERLKSHGCAPENFELIAGFYENTLTEETKNKLGRPPVCFVNIDVDYYSSTRLVLDWIEDLLFDGSIVYFDDILFYNGNPRKGQLRAISEFNESRTHSGLYQATYFDTGGRVYLYWKDDPVESEKLSF